MAKAARGNIGRLTIVGKVTSSCSFIVYFVVFCLGPRALNSKRLTPKLCCRVERQSVYSPPRIISRDAHLVESATLFHEPLHKLPVPLPS